MMHPLLPGTPLPEAVALGRFQPLHVDHLRYLLVAKAQCAFLWVGLTAPDSSALSGEAEREQAWNNPLTYFERVCVIRRALLNEGLDRREFDVIPFPIESPQSLANYAPTSLPCLLTEGPRSRQRADLLSDVGYRVMTLPLTLNRVSATAVRRDISNGGTTWKSQVPSATVEAVETLALGVRLRALRSSRP
jgi:nicotinamide mononucleotide adenylyltransferase